MKNVLSADTSLCSVCIGKVKCIANNYLHSAAQVSLSFLTEVHIIGIHMKTRHCDTHAALLALY